MGYDSDHDAEILEHLDDFRDIMLRYQAAMLTVKTKLDILNMELSEEGLRQNPIETIRYRLKSPVSIINKLHRRGLPLSLASMAQLTDIAGLRVVCSFLDDVYDVRDDLLRQDDVVLLQEKDYIKSPKENGYRSLHLIVRVPVFLASQKYEVPVEVQVRTLAQELWASNEHKLLYKQDVEDPDVRDALHHCADALAQIDLAMQKVREETSFA